MLLENRCIPMRIRKLCVQDDLSTEACLLDFSCTLQWPQSGVHHCKRQKNCKHPLLQMPEHTRIVDGYTHKYWHTSWDETRYWNSWRSRAVLGASVSQCVYPMCATVLQFFFGQFRIKEHAQRCASAEFGNAWWQISGVHVRGGLQWCGVVHLKRARTDGICSFKQSCVSEQQ